LLQLFHLGLELGLFCVGASHVGCMLLDGGCDGGDNGLESFRQRVKLAFSGLPGGGMLRGSVAEGGVGS
jgi:hypothetical protein